MQCLVLSFFFFSPHVIIGISNLRKSDVKVPFCTKKKKKRKISWLFISFTVILSKTACIVKHKNVTSHDPFKTSS